jgi:hypothetical protein
VKGGGSQAAEDGLEKTTWGGWEQTTSKTDSAGVRGPKVIYQHKQQGGVSTINAKMYGAGSTSKNVSRESRQGMTLVLEVFLMYRFIMLAAHPPALWVAKVPRNITFPAASSAANSGVSTNLQVRWV